MNKMLVSRWREPEQGSSAIVLSLSDEDMGEVEKAIKWLNENNPELGDCVAEWELCGTSASGGDITTLYGAFDEIIENSRYNESGIKEERGEIYGGKYQPFEKHLDAVKK